ncbi:MAG: response regulator [Pseudomonadota bacterium]
MSKRDMSKSEVLRNKTILAVDDELDILDTLEDLLEDETELILHKATAYEQARQLLFSHNYDLVILDIMGVHGFDLLEIAFHRGFPVVMLTTHALNPEALKQSIDGGAKAYLPKTYLSNIVPFLEDVLKLSEQSVWRKAISEVFALFDDQFGSTWRKSEADFWRDLENRLSLEEPVILSDRKQRK